MFPFFTGHLQVYLTSVDLINENPLFGAGIKSFRNKCLRKFIYPIVFVKVIHIILF